jgi:uncharacterized damage-inducible protein DinB
MLFYNSKDLARSFRTVRANTIQVAEDIPEDKYGFRPAEGVRTVGETLAHLATSTGWAKEMHGQRMKAADFAVFMGWMQKSQAYAATLTAKPAIIGALKKEGEDFATWLESLSDDVLAETVQFPAGMEPPTKTRFEMLLASKEHEMHHRAQLMVIERMLGITPHLTRRMQEAMSQMQQQASGAKG